MFFNGPGGGTGMSHGPDRFPLRGGLYGHDGRGDSENRMPLALLSRYEMGGQFARHDADGLQANPLVLDLEHRLE